MGALAFKKRFIDNGQSLGDVALPPSPQPSDVIDAIVEPAQEPSVERKMEMSPESSIYDEARQNLITQENSSDMIFYSHENSLANEGSLPFLSREHSATSSYLEKLVPMEKSSGSVVSKEISDLPDLTPGDLWVAGATSRYLEMVFAKEKLSADFQEEPKDVVPSAESSCVIGEYLAPKTVAEELSKI